MLSRVSFGSLYSANDRTILTYELPEDQDRIQKAFRSLSNGLVVVPFSSSTDVCQGNRGNSGVQLIDWKQDSLQSRGLLEMAGNPRRAFQVGNSVIAVSDSNVSSFDLNHVTAFTPPSAGRDVVIGQCVSKNPTGAVMPDDNMNDRGMGGGYGYDGYGGGDNGCLFK
jgi:hypothetical protein